ncbi:MAG: UvrD-helicase domain-containing protein [Gemmataceae bacterium]
MAESDLLADLNEGQREAVTCIDGPVLILAGAGSGKTRVITRRVAYLLQMGVHPANVLAITFTNKAAGEMRQRVDQLVPGHRVWISTFHSLGARLLRQYADRLGLDRDFTIYDQQDRLKVVKTAMEDAQLSVDRLTPESVMNAISKAKNQLTSPDRYAQQARDFFSMSVAKVYPIYEKRLHESSALDFDDLLYWPALALKHDQELRGELDARFKYVLIDEYQDTNQAQYQIARRLSTDYPNLCVVGDPDQCLPPGTLIDTPEGKRPIESLREGERVVSATGWGDTAAMWIDKVMCNPYKGKLVKITVEGGHVVRATPNHMCFARLVATPNTHFVYLMWKRGVGYRIGTTRGVRASKDGVIMSGLQVRANQEVADAMWIVRTCATSAEARYYEHFYSVKYGIPTLVFFVRGRRMDLTQGLIDRLYREIDTEAAAARLMTDLHLDRRYPHHRPGGVTRGTWGRRHVLFTLFGDCRKNQLTAWHYHRVQMVTTGEEARLAAASRFATRPGTKGTWRIETSRKHHHDGVALAREIGEFHESEVIYRGRLTADTTFTFMPAGHIHPGMLVPICQGGNVEEHRVESVEWEDYEGPVYDLSVPETHNFSAGNVIVHNSIYKFRGSDIRNILEFERDYPQARILTLSLNYRSTKSILAAASGLIAHNLQRKPKDLLTENPGGRKVTLLSYHSGVDEAEGIARRVADAVRDGKRRYRDFAVLVRVNALTRGLEQALIRQRVPFQIVKGLAFFDRKENRDVLAYLRLLLNPKDDVSFERIVNEPPRGIGATTLAAVKLFAEKSEISLYSACGRAEFIPGLRGKAVTALRGFYDMMQGLAEFSQAQPDELIRQVLDRSGYRKMLKDSRDEEDQQRLANIEELITAAGQFAGEDSRFTVRDWLENITLSSDIDGFNEQQDCVAVMTMHAAKGLEFPVVFLLAVEMGIIPHQRAVASRKEEEIEEERRLMFVGMTRAMEELYLTHARGVREFRGQDNYPVPSAFLDELPPDVVERVDLSGQPGTANAFRGGGMAALQGWRDAGIEVPLAPKPRLDNPFPEGSLVRHEQYGVGRVLGFTGFGATRSVKVRFQTAGERTFRLSHVKLEVLRKE